MLVLAGGGTAPSQPTVVTVTPGNRTAVKIEPAAGTEVSVDDTVVVTMTENRRGQPPHA